MLESWITNNCHAALSWARRPAFLWDCLGHSWGSLHHSCMEIPFSDQDTDMGRHLPTHLCNTEAASESGSRAWGKQQEWDTCSSRLSAGASPQGTWQHGE